MHGMMVCCGLTVCTKTNAAQRSSDVTDVKQNFLTHIQWKKELLGITNDDAVVNGDETCVHFSPSFECAIKESDKNVVAI